MSEKSAGRLALWCGILCAVLAVAFTVLMALGIAGIFTGTFQLVPVLLLAPAYLVLVTAVHECASVERKIWSHLGVVFSIPYVLVVSFNYLMQLTVVRQNPQLYPWLAMALRPDSMFGALELLGYMWQCLGLIALAGVFAGWPVLRASLLVNGFLAVGAFIVDVATANPVHPVLFVSLGAWCLLFPISTVMMGLWANRRCQTGVAVSG